MAKLSYYLDVRYAQKSGKHVLKLRICSKGKKVYMALGERFIFGKDEWDAEHQTVTKKHCQARMLNQELRVMLTSYETKVAEKFGLARATADEVYELLSGETKKPVKVETEDLKESVRALFKLHIERKADRPKSAESYMYTLTLLEKYVDGLGRLTFDDIDYEWLERFRAWCLTSGRTGGSNAACERGKARPSTAACGGRTGKKGLSVNSTAIHLENLRAINNLAKKLKLTTNYAFDDYTIRRESVMKYTMGFGELRQMWTCKGANEYEEYYLDMFRILFGLCGINCVDLYNLREENIKDGRVEFSRQKTGVYGSIRIEPEVGELIKKHRGKNGMLLDLSDRYADSDGFIGKMNTALKRIGDFHWEGHTKVMDKVYWPKITTYTARYSWATAAGMEDVPLDTIDMGLTHKGTTMADVYVRRMWMKLDHANRKVLDVVTGKAEPTYQEAEHFVF